MSNIRRLALIGLIVMVLPHAAALGRGQSHVTALVDSNGAIVYTNLAVHPNAPGRSPLDVLIDGISLRYGVDPLLVHSIIEVESNFDTRAVSRRGALGLMQLIPATGNRFGVRDFFDPAENVEGGVRYLKSLLERFEGNLDLSLAAYNAGENRVARLGRIPSIRETETYVRKVKAVYFRGSPRGASVNAAAYTRVLPTGSAPVPLTPDSTGGTGRRPVSSSIDARGVVRFSNIE